MKVAILGDLHWGVRNNSEYFQWVMHKFFEEKFFPYLNEHDIKTVIQLGDTIDNRKFVNVKTLRELNWYFDQYTQHDIQCYTLLGNHDVYNNNTNAVNSMTEILKDRHDRVVLIDSPKQLKFAGKDVLMLPWINKENHTETFDIIETTPAEYAFGHLEMIGFEMIKGVECEIGIKPSVFKHFKRVISGHFHLQATKGNIQYVGTPYQLDWNDYGDVKGFWIWDTDTDEMEFVQNTFEVFRVIPYDDSCVEYDDFDFSSYYDTITMVKVEQIADEVKFGRWLTELRKVIYDDKIVSPEDHYELDASNIKINVDDPLSVFIATIDNHGKIKNKTAIKNRFYSLYKEALEL